MSGVDAQLRVAVLVDDEYIERWQRNALSSLLAEADVTLSHVVVNDRTRRTAGSGEWATFARNAVDRIRQYPLWSLVGVARLLTAEPEYRRPVHIDSLPGASEAKQFSCRPRSVSEFWNELPHETVERLENVDVVVRFGFGMLKGRILEAPTYGVLSYHHGDIRRYRGQPSGLWEFLNDEPRMGVTVQRLTDTLDGGEIAALETIDISGPTTWQENRTRTYARAERLLVPAVRSLVGARDTVERPDRLGDLYRIPRGWDVARYVVENTSARLQSGIVRRVSLLASAWGVPGAVGLLFVVGLLIGGLHPLFTHHYLVPVHLEQIAGFALAVTSAALLSATDRQRAV